MKKFIVLVSLLVVLFTSCSAYDRCVPENYCMACSLTVTNKCEACFNWGSGKILAKALNTSADPNNCLMDVGTKVKDCKYYNGSTTTAELTTSSTTCSQCNKDFLKWTSSTSTAVCQNEPYGLCLSIPNCLTTTCFIGSTVTTRGCRQCKRNYSGSNYDGNNDAGSERCVKAIAINNCEYSFQ